MEPNLLTFDDLPGRVEMLADVDVDVDVDVDDDVAYQQKRELLSPAETPESRRHVEVLVHDWMWRSMEQDDGGDCMVREGDDEVVCAAAATAAAVQQQQRQQILTPARSQPQSPSQPEQVIWEQQPPTPADTPESRRPGDEAAAAASTQMGDCTSVMSLGGSTDRPDTPRAATPRVHVRVPARRLCGTPRVQKRTATGRGKNRVDGGRGRGRRRRTEAELTMYHAIRWLGLSGVVPNVSVVTGEPLVRMPLPCTFGGGGNGNGNGEEARGGGGDGDFAVGLSRAVVRNIERRRAERRAREGVGA